MQNLINAPSELGSLRVELTMKNKIVQSPCPDRIIPSTRQYQIRPNIDFKTVYWETTHFEGFSHHIFQQIENHEVPVFMTGKQQDFLRQNLEEIGVAFV